MLSATRNLWRLGLAPSLVTLTVWLARTSLAIAVPLVVDESLGVESSRLVVPEATTTLVEGGGRRGSILFHSFDQFGVGLGQQVLFQNPAGVDSILTRVTGGHPTEILGTLGVHGPADLFLINPQGITFGPEAQLNLAGSFVASTADSLQLGDYEFSAIAPQSVPLLTISTPIGLNLGPDPGPIINQSVAGGIGLAVPPFETLALIGGDISFSGGRITTVDGQIHLGAVANTQVNLSETQARWQVVYPDIAPNQLSNISFSEQSIVSLNTVLGNPASEIYFLGDIVNLDEQSALLSINSSSRAGGNIVIEARDLTVIDGGQMISQTQSYGAGGDIVIHVSERAQLTRTHDNHNIAAISRLISETSGAGQAGEIEIYTGELLIEYDSGILNRATNFAVGNGGNVTIHALDTVRLQYPPIFSTVRGGILLGSQGSGNAGSLTIEAPTLIVTDSHLIVTGTFLSGRGGDINIVADELLLRGPASSESAQIAPEITTNVYGSGDGGNLSLTTEQLTVQRGALISTFVFSDRDQTIRNLLIQDPALIELIGLPDGGTGNAGNVSVVADAVTVDGFNPFSPSIPSQISSITLGRGDAGDVSIATRELTLRQGGGVVSSSLLSPVDFGLPQATSGLGNGGELWVTADDITVTGVNPITELSSLLGTQTGSFGHAGDAVIETQRLRVEDGGTVNSGTVTSGDGGQLRINAQELVSISGVHASSGRASTIGTSAMEPSQILRQAFFLPASPEGDVGQLTITTPYLDISDGGAVSVSHQGVGNAGDLEINASTVNLTGTGRLSATTLSGIGGDVNLNISELLLLRHGGHITVSSLGGTGNGGNLNIDAGIVLALSHENSDLVANSIGGQGGHIEINTNALFGLVFRDDLTPFSDITASSDVGLHGIVEIDSPEMSDISRLEALSMTFANANHEIRTACLAEDGANFITSGRGGVPILPDESLLGTVTLEDWREPPPEQSRTDTAMSPSVPMEALAVVPAVFEAHGWQRNAMGEVELLAQRSPQSVQRLICLGALN